MSMTAFQFTIYHNASQMLFDVEGDARDGTTVVLRPAETNWDDGSQHWIGEDAGNGFFYIRHITSSLYLTVMNANPYCGTPLILSNKSSCGTGQKFKFCNCEIITDLCIPGRGSICVQAQVQCGMGYVYVNEQTTCEPWSSNQKWTRHRVDDHPVPTCVFPNVSTAIFIYNACLNMYLDVEGDLCHGIRVVLRPKDRCWGDRTQHWIREDAGCGYFYVKHADESKGALYLTVKDGSYLCGNGLVLASKGACAGQRFKFQGGLIISELKQPCIPVICVEGGQSCGTGFVMINGKMRYGAQAQNQQWSTPQAN